MRVLAFYTCDMNELMQCCPNEPEAAKVDYRHSGPLVRANMRICLHGYEQLRVPAWVTTCVHICAVQWALGVVWAWARARGRGRERCLGRGQGLTRIELQVAVRVGTRVDLHTRV